MERDGGRRIIFNLYVGSVIAVGALILLAAALNFDLSSFAGAHPPSFWLYTAGLLVCELKPVPWLRRQDGEFTASWTFAVALMLSAPLPTVLLVLAASSLIGDWVNRNAPVQTAFNIAQLTISMGIGAGLLRVFGGGQALLDPTQSLWPYLPLAVLAATSIYVINSALTMTVLALHQDTSVRSMIRRGLPINLTIDGMLMVLAPIMVVVAQRSLLLTPLLMLVAWAVYDSAARALARQHDAMHDQLTQLPNRRMFAEEAKVALEDATRRGRQVAVMLADLDGFKEINDRLGHHVGDAVLQAVSERFRSAVRSQDLVSRLGGDEFAVLITHLDSSEAAVRRAGELLASLEEPCTVGETSVQISGSFGIAMFPEHGLQLDALLQRADKAMYHAKFRRLGISMFNEARDRDGHGRLSVLAELREALDAEALGVDFMPRVRLSDGVVTATETILRWEHPIRGLIPPEAFVPLAEDSDVMARLSALVRRKALAQCAAWQKAGIGIEISVPVAAPELLDPGFAAAVEAELSEAGLTPDRLEISVVESTITSDAYHMTQVLESLRALGVRVALKDFGAGALSLAALRDLPIDRVKLDPAFVAGLAGPPREALVLRSVVTLAAGLGLETVAGGVDSPEAMAELASLGCDHSYGTHIALPAGGPVLTPWLARRCAAPTVGPTPLEAQP